MKNYKIITDSISDISDDVSKKLDVVVMQVYVRLGEKVYLGNELHPKDFYEKIREKALVTTSQINPEIYEEEFKKYLDEGIDILYIGGSTGITSTVNSAVIAAKNLREKYPKNKIVVIDSLCASLGLGILIYEAVKMRDAGKSFDELCKWIEENKLCVCHWFSVDDLFHLKRGGRISGVAAAFGSVLGVKPVMNVNNEGKLTLIEKVRGTKKVLEKFIEKMKNSEISMNGQRIFISHADAKEKADELAGMIKENFNPEDVVVDYIRPVIGAHTGVGALALFFIADKR